MSDSDSNPLELKPNPLELKPLPSDKQQYFNGFQIGIGPGDIILTLSLNGESILTLNASFTVAKTLGIALAQTVEILERATSHGIMIVDDIKNARAKIDEQALALHQKATKTK